MTRLAPNASTALANARGEHRRPSQDWTGYCLKFVRSAFGAPALGGDAHTAWHDAKDRHPLERNPPAGVPLFFRGGDHGHVVISRGRRRWIPGARLRCWSTDFVRPGKVDRTTVEAIEASSWGMTYVGSTRDINGVEVTGYAQPTPPPSVPHVGFHRRLRLGMRGADVADMKQHLWGKRTRTAVYGPASRRKVVRLQRQESPRLGTADGIVGPLTWRTITSHS